MMYWFLIKPQTLMLHTVFIDFFMLIPINKFKLMIEFVDVNPYE